jgi:dTDP-4-amino-4,6-dideoxygalactose transaminase
MLRERFCAEDALLCGSGTQALQLALLAARARSGGKDLVALPAYTCYDVASAAIGADARVTFYDIDPETLAPDTDSLVRALERGPAAVVIAPLYGWQPEWDTLGSLSERHGVTLIEDAAQSFGARWRGHAAGGLGELSVLSFGRGKGWTAVEGGALLGPEQDLALLSGSLRPASSAGADARLLVRGLVQWGFGRPMAYAIPSMLPGLRLGETVYHPPRALRRMSPTAARLALATSAGADLEAEGRRARAQLLADELRRLAPRQLRVPRVGSGTEPGSVRFPVLVSGRGRARLLHEGRAAGIMPGYPRSLPELPPLASRIVERESHPGAEALARTLVTVPTHSLITTGDMSQIFELLRDADG